MRNDFTSQMRSLVQSVLTVQRGGAFVRSNSWLRFFLYAAVSLTLWFVLGSILPEGWGVDNGPVENTQNVVLLTALAICIKKYCASTTPYKHLWVSGALLTVFAIARELSWGRAFYTNEAGAFLPLSVLPWAPLVKPAILVILAGTLVFLLLGRPIRYLREYRLPWAEFAAMLLFLPVIHLTERVMIFPMIFGDLWEELAELMAYFFFTLTIWRMKTK